MHKTLHINKAKYHPLRGLSTAHLAYPSLGLLGLLGLALLSPIAPSSADATQNSTSTNTIRAVVNAAAVVSLALDSEATIDVSPTGAGTFASARAGVEVSTNSPAGYSLYLKTLDHSNAMTSTDTNQTATIAPLEGTATASTMQTNTWGYALTESIADGTTAYAPVPMTDQQVGGKDSAAADVYNLTFATKVDTSLPAGQYENTVQISAIANPTTISTLSELVYMQDMTPSICADTGEIAPGEEISKRLIDSRDGKRYWVSKLADQNCWMVQNLALDLSTERTLTDADTDLNSKADWTPEHSTNDYVADPSWFSTYSFNAGDYVIIEPNVRKTCPVNKLNECSTAFQEVSGWQPTLSAGAGTWDGQSLGYVAVKSENGINEYDAHYLVGNYYQFNTATAGSGGPDFYSPESSRTDANTLADAPDSICPKGWKMPVSGDNFTTGQPFDREDSIYRLFRAYSYPETGDYLTDVIDGGSRTAYTPPQTTPSYRDSALAPMHGVYAGVIDVGAGPAEDLIRPSYLGNMRISWNATSLNVPGRDVNRMSSALAIGVDYNHHNDIAIYPSNTVTRQHATTIRCLAR